MAAQWTLMVQAQDDDPDLAPGAVRGWKVGFGSAAKGTVVSVYVATADGASTNVTEVPLLDDGKADVDAVAAYLLSFGVVLTDAVKQVIVGA